MKFALLLMALLASPIQAQEFHWGVHFGPVVPVGDLAKVTGTTPGLGGDLHLLIDFGGAHALRARLGGMNFSSVTDSGGGRQKVQATSGAFDYLWFADDTSASGFYLLCGADWTRWRTDHSGIFVGAAQETQDSLGGTFGFGYQFTRVVGVEASFFQSRFRQTQGSANGIMVGFSYRP